MDSFSVIIAFISIAIALISVLLTYFSIKGLQSLHQDLEDEFTNIKNTNDDTQNLIARVARLFDASEKTGLEMIYETRIEGLERFSKHIREEDGDVVIVGSSLLGLFFSIKDFDRIVANKPESFRFILTHPSEANRREGPEGRTGQNRISGEVNERINKLIGLKVPEDNIRLYKGSPTVFMIMTSQHMLLNPYPYGEMAYHCFCIEISANGPIFRQYREKHYVNIWDSEWMEKASDFLRGSDNEQKVFPKLDRE